jgi:hypothetical protein
MTELRDFMPQLARKMAEDFDLYHRAFFFYEVMIDYLGILDCVIDMYLLPDPEPAKKSTEIIEAFLQGKETREGLKKKLRTILEDWEKKTEGQGATIREITENLPDDELPF